MSIPRTKVGPKEIQLLQVSLHVKEGNNLPINQAPSSKIKKQCLDTTKQYF
jgi:hypothetical protein